MDTYTIYTSDEHDTAWAIEVKVLTWGSSGRNGPPETWHPPEPPEYEVLAVTDETGKTHPAPDAFAAERDDDIWADIDDQWRDNQEDYRV